MITKEDKSILERISKNEPAKKIADKLNEDGVKPMRAKVYNERIIMRIINGHQEDEAAELAIFEYFQELKHKKERAERIRRELHGNHGKPSASLGMTYRNID